MGADSVLKNFAQLRSLGLNANPLNFFLMKKPFFYRGSVCVNDCSKNISLAVDAYSCIGHNCELINTMCGRYCSIGHHVIAGVGMHAMNEFSMAATMYRSGLFDGVHRNNSVYEQYQRLWNKVKINHDVHIAKDVLILNDVEIGCGAVLMPNTVVTKDVPPFAIVKGTNKIVGYRFSDEIISDLMDIKWWDYDLPKMQKKIQVPCHSASDLIQFFKNTGEQDLIKLPEKWMAFYRTAQSVVLKKLTHEEMLGEFERHLNRF